MADYTLSARITADISGFTRQLSRAESNLDKFADKYKSPSSLAASIGDAFSTIGGVITGVEVAMGGIAVGGLVNATTAAIDFDTQMRKVGAISGATGSELEQLSDTAKQLGADTTLSADEVATAMTEMAVKGFDTADIISSMPVVISAAEASGEDLAVVADTMSSAINGFGLEAEDAAHVADVLAEAANRSAADVQSLQYAFKYAAPVAQSLGVELEEAAAATAIMTDAGLAGEQAGTTLRAMMLRLAKPTDKAAAVMEELGFSAFDAQGEMKSMETIIAELADATAGLTQEQQANALATIFGTEAMSGVQAMVNAGSDAIGDMTTALSECDGASEAAADAIMGGVGGAVEQLSGSMETLSLEIGERFTPTVEVGARALSGLIDRMTEGLNTGGIQGAIDGLVNGLQTLASAGVIPQSIADGFAKAQEKLESFGDKVAEFAGIASEKVGEVSDVLQKSDSPFLQGLGDMLDTVSDKLGDFSENSGGIVAALAGIGAIGPALLILGKLASGIGVVTSAVGTLFSGFSSLVQFFTTTLPGAISTANGSLTGLSAALGAPLGVVLAIVAAIAVLVAAFIYLWNTNETFRSNILGIWEQIKTTWDEFTSSVVDGLNALGFDFEDFTEVLRFAWDTLCQFLEPVFTNAFQAVADVFSMITGMISGAFNMFVGLFTGDWERFWGGIKEYFGAILGAVVDTFRRLLGRITGVADAILGLFGTSWEEFWGGIKDWFADIWDGILLYFKGIVKKIKKTWDGITEFAGGVIDGLGSAVDSMVNGAKNIINGFIDGINFAIDIINNIPGVEISPLQHLAHGTDNWQGGFAVINEGGRGELVNLPDGSQVIPHDISEKYAKEAASANVDMEWIDYDTLGAAMAAALGDVDVSLTTQLDGRVVAKQITPLVDRNMARSVALAARS